MSSDHWTVRGRVPFYLLFALSLTAALALIVATGRNVTYAGRSSNFVAPSQSLDAPLDPARSVTAAGGLSWQFDTLVSSATPTSGVYFGNSLELDASDVPHVGYYDHLNGDLVYAYRSGSAWQTTTVDSADDVGMHTSLALDSGGYPHISYYDATNLYLKYAGYNGSSWATETADATLYTGGYTSIALDSNDNPHISHYRAGSCGDENYCNLWYASYDGSWTSAPLHSSTANVGRFTSLALDSNDYPHISYHHLDNGWLSYLYHNGVAWQWDLNPADNGGTALGHDTSLALDSNDRPHIAYYDDQSSLRYAHYNGTSWITETVDSTANVGRSASLALDSSERPHISYYDLDNNTLKYAHYDGSTWQIEVVESTGNVTGHEGTSLALDSVDLPHITYYTATGLRYAYAEVETVYLPLVLRNYPSRYAVIVGVADYENDSGQPGGCTFLADLPYPDNDVTEMRDVLINEGGFPSSNVMMLVDSQATKAGIEDAITNWLAPQEGSDDLVIFYFAGHGMREDDIFPEDEADGYDEYLIPYDWECDLWSAIVDDELDSWLDTLDSQHVVVFSGSCYSGGLIGASAASEAGCTCRCLPSPADLDSRALIGDGLRRDINQSGRLVLTASREDETAYECDSLQHGVFSYYLLESLRTLSADTHDGDGWVSGEEAYDYLRPRVESEMCYQPWLQHPQISDGIPGEQELTQP